MGAASDGLLERRDTRLHNVDAGRHHDLNALESVRAPTTDGQREVKASNPQSRVMRLP
jgi:hypothetical protein